MEDSLLKKQIKSLIHEAKSPLANILLLQAKRNQKKVLSRKYLKILRSALDIQLNPDEIRSVLNVLYSYPKGCNFLVFGLGYDSIMWHSFNKNGKTVFLESDSSWQEKITHKYKDIESFSVTYQTKRSQWQELLKYKCPPINLPKSISNLNWDLILVDGPPGHFDHEPGRMQSIFMASQLVKKGGSVFIHDIHRKVEKSYADEYFKEEDFVGRVGLLQQYRVD